LHGFKFVTQMQSFGKFGESPDPLVLDLEAPLVGADPQGDRCGFAPRVVDGVVKHLHKRVGHDARRVAIDVEPEFEIAKDTAPDLMLR